MEDRDARDEEFDLGMHAKGDIHSSKMALANVIKDPSMALQIIILSYISLFYN